MEKVHPLKQAYRDSRAQLLCFREIRKRIIFDLLNHYFADLELVIPIGHGFCAPLHFRDAVGSLQEIFFEGDYEFFDKIPLPQRWLDIGCHAGFFSLFIAWRQARSGNKTPLNALLIDADPRMKGAVQRMISVNKFQDSMSFLFGAVGESSDSAKFNMRSGLISSLACYPALESEQPRIVEVPIITAGQITKALSPPYDLIKVDIEGSEYRLIKDYPELFHSAQHIVLEWHSWHSGGGSKDQIISSLAELGFEVKIDSRERPPTPISKHMIGILVLSKKIVQLRGSFALGGLTT